MIADFWLFDWTLRQPGFGDFEFDPRAAATLLSERIDG